MGSHAPLRARAKGHPLRKKKKLSLAHLAQYRMIHHGSFFENGVAVISAFSARQIAPNVVLSATDAGVIKAFVASGMGIATLPEISFGARRDADLQSIHARHLLEPSVSNL